MTQFSVQDFFKRFPDDDSCLNHLMKIRFGHTLDCPKCQRHGKFSRIKKLPAYQCSWCGHHIHPMVGTPFESSRTSLQKWFYAMYLFTTSRHGVPAKELQRQLGVTYKTAWRMGHEIRKYLDKTNGNAPLSGHIEVDEVAMGGRGSKKTHVVGMLQRKGDLRTEVIENRKKESILPHIHSNIAKRSVISSDESHIYKQLKEDGYYHGTVNHHSKQFVNGIHHTNNIDGFWSLLKRSINGTYIHVSAKHMPKYLAEFEYRYNMRKNPAAMFPRLLLGF